MDMFISDSLIIEMDVLTVCLVNVVSKQKIRFLFIFYLEPECQYACRTGLEFMIMQVIFISLLSFPSSFLLFRLASDLLYGWTWYITHVGTDLLVILFLCSAGIICSCLSHFSFLGSVLVLLFLPQAPKCCEFRRIELPNALHLRHCFSVRVAALCSSGVALNSSVLSMSSFSSWSSKRRFVFWLTDTVFCFLPWSQVLDFVGVECLLWAYLRIV